MTNFILIKRFMADLKPSSKILQKKKFKMSLSHKALKQPNTLQNLDVDFYHVVRTGMFFGKALKLKVLDRRLVLAMLATQNNAVGIKTLNTNYTSSKDRVEF